MFRLWKSKAAQQREDDQLVKLESGHQAMQSALAATTLVTEGLLEWFRNDAQKAEEASSADALLLCNIDGTVAASNAVASSLFLGDTVRRSIKDFLIPHLIRPGAVNSSLDTDNRRYDAIWTDLFDSPPKTQTVMTVCRENGDRFAVDVAMTRLDHLADTPKLFFLIRMAKEHGACRECL